MLYHECKSGNILVKLEDDDEKVKSLRDFMVALYYGVTDSINVTEEFAMGNPLAYHQLVAIVGDNRDVNFYNVTGNDATKFNKGGWVTLYSRGQVDLDYALSEEFIEQGA